MLNKHTSSFVTQFVSPFFDKIEVFFAFADLQYCLSLWQTLLAPIGFIWQKKN
jgi:hypothetical protein